MRSGYVVLISLCSLIEIFPHFIISDRVVEILLQPHNVDEAGLNYRN